MAKVIDWKTYISVDSDICHGKPCFKGTRIMVYLVIEMIEDGAPIQEILEAYPSLSLDSIKAALHFASEVIQAIKFDTLMLVPSGRG